MRKVRGAFHWSAGERLVDFFPAHRESQRMTYESWDEVLNRNLKGFVAAMSPAVVDNSGPASFGPQLTLNSGIGNATMAKCTAYLMNPSVNALM